MTAHSQLDEKILLVYLNLNHKDRMSFYEPLEDFIDRHQRVYLHVAAGNRAVLIWAQQNESSLEAALIQRCCPEDHVAVRELKSIDHLPKDADQSTITTWLHQQPDWIQWHKNYPDSPALPTRGVEWLEEMQQRRQTLAYF